MLVKCVAVYLRELPKQSSSLISYVSGLTEKDNFIEVFAVLGLDLAASDGFENSPVRYRTYFSIESASY